MDQEINSPRRILKDTHEIPSTQVISRGIRGKNNGLICFGDKDEFLKTNTHTIAWSALTGKLGGGRYCNFGLDGIKRKDFTELQKIIPGKDIINNYMRTQEIYMDGKKDFLIFFGGDNSNLIGYSWLPSSESTGDHRGSINILIAQVSPKIVKTLKNLATKEPTTIYNFLTSILYPTALIPLTDNEIMKAVEKEAPEIIKLTSFRNPDQAKQYQSNLINKKLLISNVQSKSILKRRAPCEQIEIIQG